MLSPKGSSRPRDQPTSLLSSELQVDSLPTVPPGKPSSYLYLSFKTWFMTQWASLMAQLVKNPPGFDPWVGKIP